jgi:hypothetical protein
MKKYDDGNWIWEYSCQYVNDTDDPKDYSYQIAFSTPEGGYLNGEEISCRYWKVDNLLFIHRRNGTISFYVENFSDIAKIIKPMVKATKATPYTIHVGDIRSQRKSKLIKISKLRTTLEKLLDFIEEKYDKDIDKEYWLKLQKKEKSE